MGDSIIRDGRPADAGTRAPDEARLRGEGSAFNFNERQESRDSERIGDRHVGRESESVPDLIRDLVHQGSHLADKQVELVQAEMRSAVGDLKESTAAMAGAAVLGISGIGVTLMGLAFLLDLAMPLWLGTLIVGVAALVGAYAMFKGAQEKLRSNSMTMDRTRRTLERAPSAITANEREARHGR
ncbi:MAG TPA: phage holin family protein [Sphingomicrobium sp.]|nr:phage holin family protein [Sphingomicrobium sp.]